MTTLDYKAAITIALLAMDFVGRLLKMDFTSPNYFDSLVTLAVGFWFGTEKKPTGE